MKHTCPKCGHIFDPYCFDLSNTRTLAERTYISSKNHPKLREANEFLLQAKKLEEEVRQEALKEGENLKARWEYRVKVFPYDNKKGWYQELPSGIECVEVFGTLLNKQDFEDFLNKYGYVHGMPEDKLHSVTYWRLNGVLLHVGGGYIILQYNVPCSDEEWEAIKQGNIPPKFLEKRL